jgi:menaquinone-9 beta-reductase
MVFDTDVLIIGGGPAGLAAALAVREKGFEVVVAEGIHPPVDKACGEGLMPDSLEVLARLGVRGEDLASCPFRGIRFVDGALAVEADFPSGHGLGIRRVVLHPAMVEAARAAGVRILWDSPVSGLAAQVAMVAGREITARWLIGADGESSRVRSWAGLDAARSWRVRFGFRRHWPIAPWSEYMELHWGPRGQIYVTPVGPSEICVTLISRDSRLRLDEALPEFPQLAARLGGVEPVSNERGAATVSRRLASVATSRIALVGDASGSVDAITGEGLCVAFRQALALAEALEAGDLGRYRQAHRAIGRRPVLMSELTMLLDNRPRLRARSLRAMSAHPRLFSKLLAMHVGALSPLEFAANGANLAYRLLTA